MITIAKLTTARPLAAGHVGIVSAPPWIALTHGRVDLFTAERDDGVPPSRSVRRLPGLIFIGHVGFVGMTAALFGSPRSVGPREPGVRGDARATAAALVLPSRTGLGLAIVIACTR